MINIQRIFELIDKGDIKDKINAFAKIKEHISKAIEEEQKRTEQEANDLQQTLDSINGR